MELNLAFEIEVNPVLFSTDSNSREETNGGSQNMTSTFFNVIEDCTTSANSRIQPHNSL